MRAILPVCLILALSAARSPAQVKVDLAKLPDQIKALPWRSIDPASVSPLERGRASMLLGDFLDEIDAQQTAEADLLSDYIDQKDLGPEFASRPPVQDPTALTLADSQKVAVAMLRGPMATSSYAKALADVPTDSLGAYLTLYDSTCQRRWAEMLDSRMQSRSMTRFLASKNMLADYRAWVPGEIQRRAQEQRAEMERRRASAVAAEQQQRQERLNQLEEQRKKEEAESEQAALQMQQALAAAQQSQPADSGSVVNDDYPSWYYGGVVPWGAWTGYRDGAYRGDCRARVDHRASAWRGGRGFRGGGRR